MKFQKKKPAAKKETAKKEIPADEVVIPVLEISLKIQKKKPIPLAEAKKINQEVAQANQTLDLKRKR